MTTYAPGYEPWRRSDSGQGGASQFSPVGGPVAQPSQALPQKPPQGTGAPGYESWRRSGTGTGTPPAPGTFSASNNLINSQIAPQAGGGTPATVTQSINPAVTARTGQYQGMTDNAATTFANWQPGAQQSPGYQAVQGPNYGTSTGMLDAMRAQWAGSNPATMAAQFGGGYQQSADSGKVQAMTLADLEKVRGGVDRAGIAANVYDTLAERGRPEFEGRVRQLGQKTAALGRVGSGIYGSNLTDLNAERDRELSLSRQELANGAASETLNDRLSILNATRGVGSDFAATDAARGADAREGMRTLADMEGRRFNQGMDLANAYGSFEDRGYNARREERDTAYNVGRDQYGDAMQRDNLSYDRARDRFTTLGDYGQTLTNNDRADRNELRGERDYQYGLNRDAIGDARSDRNELRGERDYQYGLSRDAVNDEAQRYRQQRGDWGQDFDVANSRGFASDPTRTRQYMSGQYGDQASSGWQGLGDALGEYMFSRSTRGARGRSAPSIQLPQQPTIPRVDLPPVNLGY